MLAGYLAIVIFSVVGILLFGTNYTVYMNNPYHSRDVRIEYSVQGNVENTDIIYKENYTVLKFKSLKAGTAEVKATVSNESDEHNYMTVHDEFTVQPTRVIYVTGYDYGGFHFTIFGMALLTLYTFAICLFQFRYRKKTQFFSHKTMLDLALLIFFGLQGLMYTGLFAGARAFRG